MQKFVVAALLALSLSAVAATKKAPAKGHPSKDQCEKALANMYRLAGITPNEDAKKDNESKCEKEYSKAFTECVTAAKSADALAACKGK